MSPFEALAVGLLGLAAVFAGGLLVGGILGKLDLTAAVGLSLTRA